MDLLICGAHHQKWDIKGLICTVLIVVLYIAEYFVLADDPCHNDSITFTLPVRISCVVVLEWIRERRAACKSSFANTKYTCIQLDEGVVTIATQKYVW